MALLTVFVNSPNGGRVGVLGLESGGVGPD